MDHALRDIFGDHLVELGKLNENIVVLDCDLSSSTRTSKFGKVFPNRFFNMGIAEQNMTGVALGFAISGRIPVVSGFSIFLTGRAWEFIRLACHDNLNLKIVATHGGVVGEDGSTHNALEDISLMASIPNINILIPSDNIELTQILGHAVNNYGPYYIRLPRGTFPLLHNDDYKFSIGKPDILNDGDDICLIGCGFGTVLAMNSIPKIKKKFNLSIKVINLPTIKPIDNKEFIKEIKKTNGAIIIEEHNIYCGVGSILSKIIAEYNPIPREFICVDDSF